MICIIYICIIYVYVCIYIYMYIYIYDLCTADFKQLLVIINWDCIWEHDFAGDFIDDQKVQDPGLRSPKVCLNAVSMWTVGFKAASNRVNRSQQSSIWLEQSTLKLQQLVREKNTCISLVQHLTLPCIYICINVLQILSYII